MTRYLLLIIGAVGLALAGPAVAHSPLEKAEPADGTTVAVPPETLTLEFRDAVILTALSLKRRGEEIPVNRESRSDAETAYSIPLPPLSPGDYTVDWRALSEGDGHVMTGRLSFTVVPH